MEINYSDRKLYTACIEKSENKESAYRKIEEAVERRINRLPDIKLLKSQLKKIILHDLFYSLETKKENHKTQNH